MQPFKVHILGCGSALPTARHYASAQIVELRDRLYMIDCGEGTQMQLRRMHADFARIGHIFISHMHGDHCFGLPGLISTFGMLDRSTPLHLHAHKSMEPLLRGLIGSFCPDLGYEVVFHAVDTERESVLHDDSGLTVSSLPLEHRVPCCGFVFREKPTLPHIRRDMIDMYGISLSQINNIKNGADGITPDGQTIPHERLVSPPAPVRAYAYCSDTRYIPTLHTRLGGVTTLYHESTYANDKAANAALYHHSTAEEAAKVARDAGVGKLIIGHYSARYADESVLLNEARAIFPNTLLADELKVFDV